MNCKYVKYFALIKDKWLNQTKSIAVTTTGSIQEAHKFVYYKYTTNTEDIVRMKDIHGRLVYTLQRGFI